MLKPIPTEQRKALDGAEAAATLWRYWSSNVDYWLGKCQPGPLLETGVKIANLILLAEKQGSGKAPDNLEAIVDGLCGELPKDPDAKPE